VLHLAPHPVDGLLTGGKVAKIGQESAKDARSESISGHKFQYRHQSSVILPQRKFVYRQ